MIPRNLFNYLDIRLDIKHNNGGPKISIQPIITPMSSCIILDLLSCCLLTKIENLKNIAKTDIITTHKKIVIIIPIKRCPISANSPLGIAL